jgi:hypothetical protein
LVHLKFSDGSIDSAFCSCINPSEPPSLGAFQKIHAGVQHEWKFSYARVSELESARLTFQANSQSLVPLSLGRNTSQKKDNCRRVHTRRFKILTSPTNNHWHLTAPSLHRSRNNEAPWTVHGAPHLSGFSSPKLDWWGKGLLLNQRLAFFFLGMGKWESDP